MRNKITIDLKIFDKRAKQLLFNLFLFFFLFKADDSKEDRGGEIQISVVHSSRRKPTGSRVNQSRGH